MFRVRCGYGVYETLNKPMHLEASSVQLVAAILHSRLQNVFQLSNLKEIEADTNGWDARILLNEIDCMGNVCPTGHDVASNEVPISGFLKHLRLIGQDLKTATKGTENSSQIAERPFKNPSRNSCLWNMWSVHAGDPEVVWPSNSGLIGCRGQELEPKASKDDFESYGKYSYIIYVQKVQYSLHWKGFRLHLWQHSVSHTFACSIFAEMVFTSVKTLRSKFCLPVPLPWGLKSEQPIPLALGAKFGLKEGLNSWNSRKSLFARSNTFYKPLEYLQNSTAIFRALRHVDDRWKGTKLKRIQGICKVLFVNNPDEG